MTLSMSSRYTPDRSVILALRGEVDYASAPDLRAAISTAAARHPRPPRIVLDLGGVTSIDHVGVGTLVVGTRICRQIGIDLAVSTPSPLIRRLLGLPETQRQDESHPAERVAATTESRAHGGQWLDVGARAG
ncbi:STAS domain-containing protein [Actinomycetes bacterium KLBMP 9797]